MRRRCGTGLPGVAGAVVTSNTAPCANAGRGRMASPPRARCANQASQAILPSATTTRRRGSAATSASRWSAQATISSGSGLLSGGAQRTAAAIYTSRNRKPSSDALRGGDVRETGAMERAIRKSPDAPIAVAGEHAAGAIGAVRGRREAENQDACPRIAEAGHGLAPVRLVAMRGLLLARDLLAVRAQPRAPLARHNRVTPGQARCASRAVEWSSDVTDESRALRDLCILTRSTCKHLTARLGTPRHLTCCRYNSKVVQRRNERSVTVMRNTAPTDARELEALETREWLESLDYVLQHGGPARVGRLLRELGIHAQKNGVKLPFTANTALHQHASTPAKKSRIPAAAKSSAASRAWCAGTRWRWSCAPTASKTASAATSPRSPRRPRSTRSAFNHFFRGRENGNEGDVIYFQGHASPGIYARAFLEGRLSRRAARELPPRAEARRRPVVLSAPVADAGFLGVPDGLDGARADHGDLPGALQPLPRGSRSEAEDRREGLGVSRRRRNRRARSARRHHAGVAREARQPDLRHQLQPAAARRPGARQRPDHPGARGDLPRRRLERASRCSGAPSGTTCSRRITEGLLVRRMGEIVDGEYQKYAVESGAYVRKHFWGADPRLLDMVKHLSDEQLKKLTLGGHDPEQGLQRLQSARTRPRACRPSSWPARSRATASANPAKARTSPTSRRS